MKSISNFARLTLMALVRLSIRRHLPLSMSCARRTLKALTERRWSSDWWIQTMDRKPPKSRGLACRESCSRLRLTLNKKSFRKTSLASKVLSLSCQLGSRTCIKAPRKNKCHSAPPTSQCRGLLSPASSKTSSSLLLRDLIRRAQQSLVAKKTPSYAPRCSHQWCDPVRIQSN